MKKAGEKKEDDEGLMKDVNGIKFCKFEGFKWGKEWSGDGSWKILLRHWKRLLKFR